MFTEEQSHKKMDAAKELAQEEMTSQEKEIVCKMLTSQPLLKLLGQIWLIGAGQNIHQLDLMTPEGIANACKVQGKAEGVVYAFELLFSAVTEEVNLDIPIEQTGAENQAAVNGGL